MAEEESKSMAEIISTRTAQHCAQCTAHGKISLLKGHKKICPFKDCTCVHCVLVKNKRQIMAKQVKLKRLQEKNHGLRKSRRRMGKNRSPSIPVQTSSMSPENRFVYLDGNEVSQELCDEEQYQQETWRAICGSTVESFLEDRSSQKCSISDQWCPVSPLRFSHINPLQLQHTSSFLQPCSPTITMATNYLSPGVPDTDILSLNHIQTLPVYYTPPGFAVSLAQANQLTPFPGESFLQPLEIVPLNNGTPQSMDAAQTLLTLRTGEE